VTLPLDIATGGGARMVRLSLLLNRFAPFGAVTLRCCVDMYRFCVSALSDLPVAALATTAKTC